MHQFARFQPCPKLHFKSLLNSWNVKKCCNSAITQKHTVEISREITRTRVILIATIASRAVICKQVNIPSVNVLDVKMKRLFMLLICRTSFLSSLLISSCLVGFCN